MSEKKVYKISNDEKGDSYMIFCPACECGHKFSLYPNENGSKWTYNGNEDSPTFNPSMLVRTVMEDQTVKYVCHSYVTDGRIQFLSDCTHKMSGQTVDLPLF